MNFSEINKILVYRNITGLLLFFIYSSSFIYPQSRDSSGISVKTNELNELRNNIKTLEDELKSKSGLEKKSLQQIEYYDKQNLYLNKIINNLRAQERYKEKQITRTNSEIQSIKEKIKFIKDNYAKYIVYLYKHGKKDDLELILNSRSLNQALIRYKYLSKISEKKSEELNELRTSETSLNTLTENLIRERDQKKLLTVEKQDEELNLQKKLSERKILVASLKKDKAALKDEIDLKRGAENQIKNLIARLVEEEKRKEAERKRVEEIRKEEAKKEEARKALAVKKGENKTTKNNKKIIGETTENIEAEKSISASKYSTLSSFNLLRGKMKWPVDNGQIIRKFGESKNRTLNTITLNYGIDINSRSGLDVKAVAEGIVSSITWLPGYGVVLILTHGDNFRTVYGHLSEVYLNEGDKIESGGLIGKIAEGLEGNILHFEIWNERDNQNPEGWLVKK